MPNDKIRIYDLARELNIPTKQLFIYLEDIGETYTSHLNVLETKTANKLKKLLKSKILSKKDINGANKTTIGFYEASVRFGQAEVLKNIDFQLGTEEFLAIIGPNGAGKSTLIKLALGIVKPTKGKVTVFNNSVGKNFRQIGYVPQLKTFDRSFPATTLELVISGLRHRWVVRANKSEVGKATDVLRKVGAEKLLRRSLAELSGGELQRAFLARALVSKPQIVFLDEPATGVDFLAENDLYDLLENYQNEYLDDVKPTIVMITHDLAAARYHASKVLIVNRTVHGFGLPEEVMNETHLQKAFGHVGHHHGYL